MKDVKLEDMDWLPVIGYPGYEVSGYGVVCKIRKDGSREVLMPYRDKKPGRDGHRWAYVTVYKNFQPKKVAIRDILKSTWGPELERRKQLKPEPQSADIVPIEKKATGNTQKSEKTTSDKKKKRTTNPDEQTRKFKQMIDGYEPEKMSVNAYMKYLREQGYRFTTSHLSAELVKKKNNMPQKEPAGLF